jgi:hypothetical protein
MSGFGRSRQQAIVIRKGQTRRANDSRAPVRKAHVRGITFVPAKVVKWPLRIALIEPGGCGVLDNPLLRVAMSGGEAEHHRLTGNRLHQPKSQAVVLPSQMILFPSSV